MVQGHSSCGLSGALLICLQRGQPEVTRVRECMCGVFSICPQRHQTIPFLCSSVSQEVGLCGPHPPEALALWRHQPETRGEEEREVRGFVPTAPASPQVCGACPLQVHPSSCSPSSVAPALSPGSGSNIPSPLHLSLEGKMPAVWPPLPVLCGVSRALLTPL